MIETKKSHFDWILAPLPYSKLMYGRCLSLLLKLSSYIFYKIDTCRNNIRGNNTGNGMAPATPQYEPDYGGLASSQQYLQVGASVVLLI